MSDYTDPYTDKLEAEIARLRKELRNAHAKGNSLEDLWREFLADARHVEGASIVAYFQRRAREVLENDGEGERRGPTHFAALQALQNVAAKHGVLNQGQELSLPDWLDHELTRLQEYRNYAKAYGKLQKLKQTTRCPVCHGSRTVCGTCAKPRCRKHGPTRAPCPACAGPGLPR